MAPARIHRRLLLALVALLLGALIPTAWLLDSWLDEVGREDVRTSLTRNAQVLASTFALSHPDDVPGWITAVTSPADERITVIAADGHVKGDSDVPAAELSHLENHAGRPEVSTALSGRVGWDARRSTSIGRELMYVAVPIPGARDVLRVALPLFQVERITGRARSAVMLAGLMALGLALLLGYLLARLVTRPVVAMTRAALAMTAGDFTAPLPPASRDELGDLVRALQELRRQLAARIGQLRSESEKLRAIMNGMTEGVALVQNGVIAVANPAFSMLLGIPAAVEGRTPLEAARLPELAESIDDAALRRVPIKREIASAGRALDLHVLPLGEPASRQAVAVLLDVTDARRLERVRRDFVANASHELRTPVAAILGAAETLAAGASEDPGARAQFIGILDRHARRLSRLTSDLLDLSRLEAGYRPRVEAVNLRAALSAVIATLRVRAEEKQITLADRLPEAPIAVAAERAAVEQILTNLIENGIKYTPAGGSVTISASQADMKVSMIVEDTGGGIEAEHLPRLFERFYRVDDARSREMGGTGLGLAIVRHLVLANAGQVHVESQLGRGSRFIVTLPRA